MKTVCAWCNIFIRDDGKNDNKTTHGICPACKKKLEKDIHGTKERRKGRYKKT